MKEKENRIAFRGSKDLTYILQTGTEIAEPSRSPAEGTLNM